ncbi:MAG: hypothetical protein C6W57_08710 [Caldibacillus debilis]|nr:MAG: hypothetical protein C6W57_08710 [Caldibacillus debilis]
MPAHTLGSRRPVRKSKKIRAPSGKFALGPISPGTFPLCRDPASVPEDLSPGFRRNGNQTALNSFGPARQKPRFPTERGQNGFLFLCFQVPFSAKQFSFSHAFLLKS